MVIGAFEMNVVSFFQQDSNSVAPSPSANSMSSQHDEFENISSPSWPGTPVSNVFE